MTPAKPFWRHVIGCIYGITCAGGDCGERLELMLHADFRLYEVPEVVGRAASAAGWMYVLRKAYCPRCAHGLRASLVQVSTGPWADAIKMGIVERSHLQKIHFEVAQ